MPWVTGETPEEATAKWNRRAPKPRDGPELAASLTVLLLLLLALTSCIGAPWRWGTHYPAHHEICRQAAQEGWCQADCGRRRPFYCQTPKLLGCGDTLCLYRYPTGELAWGWR